MFSLEKYDLILATFNVILLGFNQNDSSFKSLFSHLLILEIALWIFGKHVSSTERNGWDNFTRSCICIIKKGTHLRHLWYSVLTTLLFIFKYIHCDSNNWLLLKSLLPTTLWIFSIRLIIPRQADNFFWYPNCFYT